MQRTNLLQLFFGLLIISAAGCNPSASQRSNKDPELFVFAAASLAEAFTEIARQFEVENPGVTVILNFAGSQQLAHQLSQGAPADVFASANERQMAAAISTGRISESSRNIFTLNHLVVVFPQDNPAELHTLADLAHPGHRLLLAAPEVPAGQYAQSFLEAAAGDPAYGPDYRNGVLDNVVSYEENVRAVLSKVRLGEADAAIVYASDAQGKESNQLGTIEIPEKLNIVATYPIAPIDNNSQDSLAQSFIDFVLSSRGQDILADFGFTRVLSTQ